MFSGIHSTQTTRSFKKRALSNALASHENPSGGELILGHASLLTSCLLTPDEKFLITADRDEHIRISWYPQGYVIESYCLGHTKYVSAIHIPEALPTSLISGGGDPELKVWDWMTGRLQRSITILAVVEPYIRKGKQRNTPSMELDSKVHPSSDSEGADKTLVVSKIGSFLSGGEIHVVFSAVGATAIFEFVLAETENQPEIRHHDLRRPVIDFTLCAEGVLWQSSGPTDHKFIEVGSSALLDSLNTICCLSATVEDLKILDLYSDLSSLPKSIRGEHESQVDERLDQPPPDEPGAESPSSSVGPTKRTLGRLKHKRALGQLHEQSDGPDAKKTKTDSDEEATIM
ncbi:hypothetical protein JVU11DRAFT_2266 [Chiua virens]|nr:hypothetical protein JVU11DRAFT_2266 [Chiua virens]